MHSESIVFSIFLIFTGAAITATIALYARQALLIGYILLGTVAGPWGLGLVSDTELIREIARVGIIFLLFLLGLNLYPQKLLQLLRQTTFVTLVTAALFAATGYAVARGFGFPNMDSIVVGVAAMFSSTIIGLKLLPTTVLHHRHMGEIMISVLLLQDLIAIVALLVLQSLHGGDSVPWVKIAVSLLSLPALVLMAYLAERFVLLRLFSRFDKVQEYIFLLAIGWCLGIAQCAHWLGLSHEIGAFVAGIAVATSPISRYIAESLKPLRDFFLVMFFFALGAGLDLSIAGEVLVPAAVLAVLMLAVKPTAFGFMLIKMSESEKLSWEAGWRLGQMSEFSLLIGFLALTSNAIADKTWYLIQVATLLTFIGSSYLIVLRYPTPMAVSDRLRRD